MVEKNAFPVNPKLQYHVSQREKHGCSAYNKKKVDYYEYACLTYFIDDY